MTFQVGDKVIYPNHGLGIVERIETKTIMGTTCGFYQLRMVSNDTTVLVPVNNVSDVGLRCAVGGDEVSRLFSLLSDGKIDSQQNWKGRFKDNSDRMRTGSLYDVVEVLKSLTFLAKSKTLSFREKRMLDRARFLVVSEIAEVTHEPLAADRAAVDYGAGFAASPTKNRPVAKAGPSAGAVVAAAAKSQLRLAGQEPWPSRPRAARPWRPSASPQRSQASAHSRLAARVAPGSPIGGPGLSFVSGLPGHACVARPRRRRPPHGRRLRARVALHHRGGPARPAPRAG